MWYCCLETYDKGIQVFKDTAPCVFFGIPAKSSFVCVTSTTKEIKLYISPHTHVN